MKIYMTAEFRLLKENDGEYEILTEEKATGLSVGGFEFVINGKDIPFDWDAACCNENDGIFTYESGYGYFFNDFEMTDCFDSDLEEMGLTRADLTPSFLSSASKINDFHINYYQEGDNGEELEINFGDNLDPDMPIRVQLLDVYFESDEDDEVYHVKEEVLKKFNGILHSAASGNK